MGKGNKRDRRNSREEDGNDENERREGSDQRGESKVDVMIDMNRPKKIQKNSEHYDENLSDKIKHTIPLITTGQQKKFNPNIKKSSKKVLKSQNFSPKFNNNELQLSRSQRSTQKNDASPWNFAVEYNDHFETPQQAYVDLLQVLIHAARDAGKPLADLVIYDPYYCQGRVVSLLQALGFKSVINNNRDFYQDIASNTIPEFDILVTNPPYSGEHKIQLLRYLQTISKPYALLLPAYTATKSYWKDFLQFESQRGKARTALSISDPVIYLLPPSSYEYSHPEGTGLAILSSVCLISLGKDLPPFYSAWFVGGTFSSLTKYVHFLCFSHPI